MIAFARRLIAFVAAFALVQAMAAPVLSACEHSGRGTGQAMVMETTGHSEHGAGSNPHCQDSPAPTGNPHDRDCLTSCVSALGCAGFSVLGESPVSGAIVRASTPMAQVASALSSISLAPDRPPPRA